MKTIAAIVASLSISASGLFAGSIWDDDYKREDYEEAAGATFMLQFNPSDRVYGMCFGDGTWLKNTPVFGDYGLDVLWNGIEGEWYAGVAMTMRLMPHWSAAPFVGVGGSYHYSSAGGGTNASSGATAGEPEDRGNSYWAWHAEGGIRFWVPTRVRVVELMARYVMTNLGGDDRDYWIAGFATGTGF
jgi:hypothetical protein